MKLRKTSPLCNSYPTISTRCRIMVASLPLILSPPYEIYERVASAGWWPGCWLGWGLLGVLSYGLFGEIVAHMGHAQWATRKSRMSIGGAIFPIKCSFSIVNCSVGNSGHAQILPRIWAPRGYPVLPDFAHFNWTISYGIHYFVQYLLYFVQFGGLDVLGVGASPHVPICLMTNRPRPNCALLVGLGLVPRP